MVGEVRIETVMMAAKAKELSKGSSLPIKPLNSPRSIFGDTVNGSDLVVDPSGVPVRNTSPWNLTNQPTHQAAKTAETDAPPYPAEIRAPFVAQNTRRTGRPLLIVKRSPLAGDETIRMISRETSPSPASGDESTYTRRRKRNQDVINVASVTACTISPPSVT